MTKLGRTLLFISHATPDDNEFARWLALQLARQGFVVWCDVTKLVGGERFWQDIESAICEHAGKFLFCASRKSVAKPGVLRELKIAQETESKINGNFIVPLKLDDVPFSDLPDNLGSTTNVVRFDHGWAVGLRAVLDMLRRDGITPSKSDGAQIVNSWWSCHHPMDEGLSDAQDLHFTNIFPITKHPEFLWFHPANRQIPNKLDKTKFFFPIEPYSNGFLTFANPNEAAPDLERFGFNSKKSRQVNLATFISGGDSEIKITSGDAQRRIYSLIRQAFAGFRKTRQLQTYAMANETECYWLKINTLKNDEAKFHGIDGKLHGRALVGFKSIGVSKEGIKNLRYWHFAIQARPAFSPVFALGFRSHVVFSNDGSTLIDSSARQHSARRSQCALWWNDTWRDRLLAMVGHLAGGSKQIQIPLSADANLFVASSPLELTAQKAYKILEPQKIEALPDDDELWDANNDEGEVANGVT